MKRCLQLINVVSKVGSVSSNNIAITLYEVERRYPNTISHICCDENETCS